MREELSLQNLRSNLIRQEETIIFSMIERSQFKQNINIYIKGFIQIPDFPGSFLDYFLAETEKVHSRVRRYTAPDEHPFTENLPEPLITTSDYTWPIKKTEININRKILQIYIDTIIPQICRDGDDRNYGSSSLCDITALQSISKRIHYGKFIAESKFQTQSEEFTKLIKLKDEQGLMDLLTDATVEEQVLNRVKIKAAAYGNEPTAAVNEFKIEPDIIRSIYKSEIIPLTKEVEVLYLLQRLD
jgi:chorismate mutase